MCAASVSQSPRQSINLQDLNKDDPRPSMALASENQETQPSSSSPRPVDKSSRGSFEANVKRQQGSEGEPANTEEQHRNALGIEAADHDVLPHSSAADHSKAPQNNETAMVLHTEGAAGAHGVSASEMEISYKEAMKILEEIQLHFQDVLCDRPKTHDRGYLREELLPQQRMAIHLMGEFLLTDGPHLEADFPALKRALGEDTTAFTRTAKIMNILSKAVPNKNTPKKYEHDLKSGGWLFAAFMAKNFLVWNVVRLLGKKFGVHIPNHVAVLAALVTTAVAMAAVEYFPQGKAHENYRKTGRKMPPALAAAQAMDMGTAAVAYKTVGKDHVGPLEALNLMSSVFGVLVGAGILGSLGEKKKELVQMFSREDIEELDSGSTEQAARASDGSRRLEEGTTIADLPDSWTKKDARIAAVDIHRLNKSFPEQRQATNVGKLRDFQQKTAQMAREAREGRITLTEEMIERLEKCAEQIRNIAGDPDSEVAQNAVGDAIKRLNDIKKSELDPNSGLDPIRIAFYSLLVGTYAVGLGAGTQIKGLDNKAMNKLMLSTIPQLPANLIYPALPEKMPSALKTLISLGLTAPEFGAMQDGYLDADKFQNTAAKAGEFSKNISSVMESFSGLPQAEAGKQMHIFGEKARALATNEFSDKAPKIAKITNELADKAFEISENMEGEKGDKLLQEFSHLVEELAKAGKGNPELIPDTRAYMELGRIALQLIFTVVELKQKLERKDWATLGIPLAISGAISLSKKPWSRV